LVPFLIETIHVGPVDPFEFAAGFDRAADLLAGESAAASRGSSIDVARAQRGERP
jgi:hypothetical protein